jgi:hypothetical protein
MPNVTALEQLSSGGASTEEAMLFRRNQTIGYEVSDNVILDNGFQYFAGRGSKGDGSIVRRVTS